jgi:predicted dehydrogenase
MSENQEHPVDTSGSTRREFMRHAVLAGSVATVAAAGPWVRANAASPNETIRVGQIGCGGRSGAHMSSYEWLREDQKMNVKITAVCDVYKPRAERAAKKYGAEKIYMDHKELLADPNVDVVSIATPDHHHGYQALDAVLAGKDVYCEKPLTHWRQYELTRELCRTAMASQQVMQVGCQAMSDSAYHQMAKMVRDGMIGQPIHGETGYFRVGDWGEVGMNIDDPKAKPGADLNWDAFLGDAPKRPFDVSRLFRWRMYEDYSGGPVTDLFPHPLTPLMHILNLGMPSKAVALGGKYRYNEREVPDTFNLLLEFPEKVCIAVLGTQGNNDQGVQGRGAGGRVPIVRGHEGSLTIVGEEILFKPAEGNTRKEKDEQRFPIAQPEDTRLFFKNFIECCMKRDKNTMSGPELALKVQTALHMAAFAQREEKTVRYDAVMEKIIV